MIKLIIFDMDGVLIDSEPVYMEMNRGLFKELAIEVPQDEYHTFIGMSAVKQWSYLKNKYCLALPVETLIFREHEAQFQYLRTVETLKPIPGIAQLLTVLQSKEIPLCIASSSPRRCIELVLEKLNFRGYFQSIISGEEVENGKPAPDIFWKAASHFQTAPADCLVIEDSTNGVNAAKAAGMKCVGFQNPNSGNQYLSPAERVIDSFSQANINIIMELISGFACDIQ